MTVRPPGPQSVLARREETGVELPGQARQSQGPTWRLDQVLVWPKLLPSLARLCGYRTRNGYYWYQHLQAILKQSLSYSNDNR